MVYRCFVENDGFIAFSSSHRLLRFDLMKSSFVNCLAGVVGLLVLLASCDLQAGPPKFVAVGKVICGGLTKSIPASDSGKSVSTLAELVATHIEIIQSQELRRRALERLRAMHPELKDSDVEIRAAQTKGAAIITVTGVGEDGKYTRVFVNALLDEYVALNKEFIGQSLSYDANKIIGEVVVREKQVEELSSKLSDATKSGKNSIEIEKIKEEYNRAKENMQHWTRALDKLDGKDFFVSVAILERAVSAVESR